MPRVVQVPDIRKVDLPEARQAIPHVHAYLRECILDGTLSPGTKLSQVSLAAQLGLSRTPLREVLRMLQEEGLAEIEPNQRTREAALDPQALDAIYASPIRLERTALRVLADCAPDCAPVAVPHAVGLIDREPPALRLTGAS